MVLGTIMMFVRRSVIRSLFGGAISIMALSHASFAGASSIEPIPYVDPVYTKIRVDPDILVAQKANSLGPNQEIRLDVYTPEEDTAKNRRTILFVHGGGFSEGDKSSWARTASEFAKRGYVTASSSYRLRFDPDRDPEATLRDASSDIAQSLRWLRRNAGRFGCSPNRIAIVGDSAGGIVAQFLAKRDNGIWNPNERTGLFAAVSLFGLLDSKQSRLADSVPVLFIHGTEDTQVPYSTSAQAASRCRAQGGYCDLMTMHGIGHSYENRYYEEIVERLAIFLNNTAEPLTARVLPATTGMAAFPDSEIDLPLILKTRTPSDGLAIQAHVPAEWTLVRPPEFKGTSDATARIRVPANAKVGRHRLFFEQSRGPHHSSESVAYVSVESPLQIEFHAELSNGRPASSLLIKNLSGQARDADVSLQAPSSGAVIRRFSVHALAPHATKRIELTKLVSGSVILKESLAGGFAHERITDVPKTIVAQRFKKAPTIDGWLDDWLLSQEAFSLKDGSRAFLGWDSGRLYMGVMANDATHTPRGKGSGIWMGDSIQLGIEPYKGREPSFGFHEIGLAMDGEHAMTPWRWVCPSRFKPGLMQTMSAAITFRNQKTFYEFSIPWNEILGGQTPPQVGWRLGLGFSLNGFDREGARTSYGFTSIKDPREFATLLLIDEPSSST